VPGAIPARAGEPSPSATTTAAAWGHPCAGGGASPAFCTGYVETGPSPRGRGWPHDLPILGDALCGSPARAGMAPLSPSNQVRRKQRLAIHGTDRSSGCFHIRGTPRRLKAGSRQKHSFS
jgi:hypothetical protein